MSRDCEIVMSVQTDRGTLLVGFMPREPARARPGGEPYNYPQVIYQLPHGAVTVAIPAAVNANEEKAS